MFIPASLYLAACLLVPAADPALTDLTFVPNDIGKSLLTGMRRIPLTSKPGTTLKAAPRSETNAWGTLSLGAAGAMRHVLIAVNDKDAYLPLVWIDSNANGDLTDDPEVKVEVTREKDGKMRMFRGAFDVAVPALHNSPVRVRFHRYSAAESTRRKLPADVLFCQADYAVRGKLAVADMTFPVIISDEAVDGDFRFDGSGDAQVALFVDRDADGQFELSERFAANDTINLGDAAIMVKSISPNGREIKIARAGMRDPQIRATESFGAGGKALPFTAKAIDGGSISFPTDFKGKLVLIDFWATWCGPCKKEIPHVIKSYDKFKHSGLEVLGISFDKPGTENVLREFVDKNRMPWRQVFPGQAIGQQWAVASIPRLFLVDGDTGEIVASGSSLRGPGMEEVIGKAIEKKFGG